MGEFIVKLIDGAIIKISAVKDITTSENGFIIVINHLGEKWYFSPKHYLYAQFMPPSDKLEENDAI